MAPFSALISNALCRALSQRSNFNRGLHISAGNRLTAWIFFASPTLTIVRSPIHTFTAIVAEYVLAFTVVQLSTAPASETLTSRLVISPNNSVILEIALTPGSEAPMLISMNVELAAKQLEALGNATRLQVYRTLVRAGQSGLPVSRVQEKLGIPASTLSHHLHRLLLTGLVTQERQATTLICRASYVAMDTLLGFMRDECCADEGCTPAQSDEAA